MKPFAKVLPAPCVPQETITKGSTTIVRILMTEN
jgi:hypothetical protein